MIMCITQTYSKAHGKKVVFLFQLLNILVLYLYLFDFVTSMPCLCVMTYVMYESHSSCVNHRDSQVNLMLMFFFNTRFVHSSFNMCHFLSNGVYCSWREIALIGVSCKVKQMKPWVWFQTSSL